MGDFVLYKLIEPLLGLEKKRRLYLWLWRSAAATAAVAEGHLEADIRTR